jgi:DnaJ-class molecular chaperone
MISKRAKQSARTSGSRGHDKPQVKPFRSGSTRRSRGKCPLCDGTGRIRCIMLGPDRTATCYHCRGTGRENKEVSDGGPLTPESKPNANPPFAAPTG